MQTASSRIWTWFSKLISNDDNRYTTSSSLIFIASGFCLYAFGAYLHCEYV